MDIEADQIILTSGAQNGLTIALLAFFHAGDKIATDVFTYFSFISLAKQLNIQLIPIDGDAEGLIPDLLDKQCKLMDIKGIFLMPSCNNPTGIAMSMERKRDIVSIIEKYNLILLEDDAYRFISDEADIPMQALCSDFTVYLHSLSKSISPGLRCSYMVVPKHLIDVFAGTASNINLTMPLMDSEVVSELIISGKAEKIITQKKKQAKARNTIYKKFFPEYTNSNIYSLFQWLPLPSTYNGYQFEMQAKESGVQVFCSDRFLVGQSEQKAVRVATCSPDSPAQLEQGLRIIKQLLDKNQEYTSKINHVL